jgi:hypothetical protein
VSFTAGWTRNVDGFRDRVAVAERQFERSMALVVAHAAVKTKSFRAAIAFLERRFPDLWVVRQRLDLTVEDPSLEDVMAETMTDAELRDELERLADEALRRVADQRQPAAS